MMSNEANGESGAEKGIAFGREIKGLLGKSIPVSVETLAKLKPIVPNEVLDREAAARISFEINRDQMEVIKTELQANIGSENFEKLKESLTSFMDEMKKDVANDIEVMGAELVDCGFPDPRLNRNNWRIIAKMVSTDPDGLMEDIYEAALAFAEAEKRATRNGNGGRQQLETEPPADGLSGDGLSLRWGGQLYSVKPRAALVLKLLVDSFLSGFPYLSEEYLKTEGECESDIRHLVRDGGLVDVVIREVGPDGKTIKGKWGLIDPQKTSTVQQIHT